MKRFLKLTLSVFLITVFTFGFLPFSDKNLSSAAETLVYGDFKYTVNESKRTAEIVGRSASALNLSIPSKINDYTVTSIADKAFADTTIFTAIIPDSVTSVGKEAFSGCMFMNAVSIGSGVSSIGEKAFYGCTSLSAFTVSSANKNFCVDGGVLYSADKSVLVSYPSARSSASFEIPSGVKTVSAYAFAKAKNLTSVSVPKTATSLGNYAFYGATVLSAIDFSRASGLKKIGEYAFSECKNLAAVALPSVVSEVGVAAFKNCTALTSAQLSSSLLKIENELFSGCSKLRDLSVYSSLIAIGDSAFENCKSLTAVIIPDSVIRVGTKAFSGCSSVASVSIGAGLGSIYANTFSGCSSLESFTVNGNKSYSSSDGILYNKSGTKLLCYPSGKSGSFYTIPETVTALGAYAFDSCKNLSKLTVPATVKTLTKPVVVNCPSLSVYVEDGSAAESYFSSYKTGIGSLKISGNSARIEPKSVGVSAGETFDVDIELINNPGLTAVAFDVSFDITKIKYVGYKDAKLLGGCRIKPNVLGNSVSISYADATASSNVTKSGTVVTLTFEALPSFTSGSTHISVTIDSDETYDYNQKAVSLKSNDGTVTIGKASVSAPGDVNNDGIVDSKDVILIRRFVADWKNISIDTDAADVNNDSKVDSKDVILIKRFVADWKGIALI